MEDLESPSLTSQSQSPISLITLESLTTLSQESQIIQARPISRGRTTMASLGNLITCLLSILSRNLTILLLSRTSLSLIIHPSLINLITQVVSQTIRASLAIQASLITQENLIILALVSLAIHDLVNLTILSLENLITKVSQAVQASLIKLQLWPVTHGHPFMLKKTYLDLA